MRFRLYNQIRRRCGNSVARTVLRRFYGIETPRVRYNDWTRALKMITLPHHHAAIDRAKLDATFEAACADIVRDGVPLDAMREAIDMSTPIEFQLVPERDFVDACAALLRGF